MRKNTVTVVVFKKPGRIFFSCLLKLLGLDQVGEKQVIKDPDYINDVNHTTDFWNFSIVSF